MKWAVPVVLMLVPAARAGLPESTPAGLGFDPAMVGRIDEAVNRAIEETKLPGAVVLVGRRGRIAMARAYGERERCEPMTRDTIFDLASLTKPVATAASVLALIDDGLLRLDSRPAAWFPEFDNGGKREITVEQLLRHRSGLTADNPIADYQGGPDRAWENIAALKVEAEPGTRFRYSDVGYIVLGKLVEKVGGSSLQSRVYSDVLAPLGMKETSFTGFGWETCDRVLQVPIRAGAWSLAVPVAVTVHYPGLRGRKPDEGPWPRPEWFAPTERYPRVIGEPLRGVVHDPRARALGGVAGHAGLFGTADDMALFAQMILDGGKSRDGRVILEPESVATMIAPGDTPPGERRGLGWDIDTPYSSPRGREFGPSSFGHTGFTGTSLWIDSPSGTFVILLTSRLYPDGRGPSPIALRSELSTIVGESLEDRPMRNVLCGVDVLARDGFAALKGKRVGLVTNHTGRTRDGRTTIDALHRAKGVELVALFSPEHGLRGLVDREVGDGKDDATGLPVVSLYGKTRKPTPESLRGIDTLVYDIQDIGTRFYTYISTLGLVLDAAGEAKLPVVVLDRPNPIGGLAVSGPVRDDEFASFIAHHAMPVRHGMTVGEIARMFVAERNIPVELTVIPCEGWRRGDLFDRTGLEWVDPSPNMRSLTQALLYPGVGLLEATNLATGRGTDTPFEKVGAPWIDGVAWSASLNGLQLPGLRFVPIRFTPRERQFAGRECGGVQILITERGRFDPIDLGLGMAASLRCLYPRDWEYAGFLKMIADRRTHEAMARGLGVEGLKAIDAESLGEFRRRREKYLIHR